MDNNIISNEKRKYNDEFPMSFKRNYFIVNIYIYIRISRDKVVVCPHETIIILCECYNTHTHTYSLIKYIIVHTTTDMVSKSWSSSIMWSRVFNRNVDICINININYYTKSLVSCYIMCIVNLFSCNKKKKKNEIHF